MGLLQPSPHAVRLYRLACADPAWTADEASGQLGISSEEVRAAVATLTSLGLLSEWETTPSGYLVVDSSAAFARLLAVEDCNFEEYQASQAKSRWALRLLISDYLGERAIRRENVQTERLTTRSHIDATLNNLTELTRREILAMHPGPVPSAEVISVMLERNQSLIERSVELRMVWLQRLAEVPQVADYLRRMNELGAGIRIAAHLPLRMLLYDENAALLPTDPSHSDAGAIVVRSPALIASLRAFFENCWINATPLYASATRPPDEGLTFTPTQEAALRMMAAGMKDEVIARRLGVSSRTLSRIMAEVMERLGVSSRFEAGAKLAHMRWFEDTADSSS